MKIFFVFLFISFPLFAQKTVLTLENVEYSNFIKDKKAFALSNSENGELALVIPDKKTIGAYLFNENFEKVNEISAKSLRIKFKEIIGYRVADQHYSAVFSTENHQFFGVVDFDFKSGKTITEQLDISLSREKVLEAVSYQNRFFLLSLDKNFDGLIVRELKEDRTFKKREIAFTGPVSFKDLLTLKNKPDRLGDLKESSFNKIYPPHIVEIDNTNPNSLETTSELNKLYTKDNKLIFTFDNFVDFTLTYTLDLDTFNLSEKRFPKELVDGNPLKKSNSFLFGDNLFQVSVDSEHLLFSIKNFKTGENIKTYKSSKDQEIDFKNSEILQKNGLLVRDNKIRELEKTSQYLRKVAGGNPGIAIMKDNEIYQITLGGTQELSRSGAVAPMPVGGYVGSTIYADGTISVMYNPTFNSFGSYTSTKSIYIHSLFDAEFQHMKGNPSENVFDKIKTFRDSLKNTHAEEVFSHNGKVYFGYYYKKSENYNIVEFDI